LNSLRGETAKAVPPFNSLEQAARNPVDVSEVWNRWPGDESIEELLADL